MPRLRVVRSGYPLVALVLAATAGLVAADPNDWVNVDYVIKQANAANTAGARSNIVNRAGSSAKSGPWSVVTKNSVAPPSGDVHDYLSWAPYHWPECNWCSKGTNHLSGPHQGNSTDDSDDTDKDKDNGSYDGDDPYEDGGYDDASVDGNGLFAATSVTVILPREIHGSHDSRAHHRMIRSRRGHPSHGSSRSLVVLHRDDSIDSQEPGDLLSDVPLPTDTVTDKVPSPTATGTPGAGGLPTSITASQSSTQKGVYGTQAPAQAPAKTSQSSSKCTPSPTKSLAPSATWTTCPYMVHDGKVNPDVRTLPDSPAVVSMTQSVFYNAVAFAVQKTDVYSQNAAKFINTWFIASSTAMNPNMNFGQLVRGPGKAHQIGTFTGILDLRGMVKVINAIKLLQAARSPHWTPALDKSMTDWVKSYILWLENSSIGKETSSKSNNHLSFFVNQLAAAKMYAGDTQGAQTALKDYFAKQFQDQVAASGEQPFEAVRTRPYHYRAFNLEAMITNAKLGDQLGLNFWTTKSKYGATIQTALDYLIGVDPKDEDVSDVFPHVAAVAAAYGDPKGKYAAFLKKNDPNYMSETFWFYDQSSALPNSPAGHALKHRRELDPTADAEDALAADVGTGERIAGNVLEAAGTPFECPAPFLLAKVVELEDGLFVTCDEVEPYYEITVPAEPAL